MSAREVTLVGGSPWGFRMHGGHDLHQPLRISRVNPGSKASQQGVREGDLISSINGRSTRELTNSEAHTLLRNAGDQLKLGLNQESSIGSPKRRIYKSSLQENTSIESIQKTTKTITTSSTRLLSSESSRNGTDDTRPDQHPTTRNGTLINQRNETTTDSASSTYKKDASYSHHRPPEMPQSKSRRSRRNRNNKHRNPPTNQPPARNNDEDSTIAAKVSSQGAKASESSGSIAPLVHHQPPRHRYKLQLHSLSSKPKICEITTLSDERLEAYIGHIAGVGIVDTTLNDSKTIVTEPVEPLAPLASHVTSRVTNLGRDEFDLAPIPTRDRPEIREVVDSDVEEANISCNKVVSEAESGIKVSIENQREILKNIDSSAYGKEKGRLGLRKPPLRSFKIPSFGIVTEPESDSDHPGFNDGLETLETYATFSDSSVNAEDLCEISKQSSVNSLSEKPTLRALINIEAPSGQEQGQQNIEHVTLEPYTSSCNSSANIDGCRDLADTKTKYSGNQPLEKSLAGARPDSNIGFVSVDKSDSDQNQILQDINQSLDGQLDWSSENSAQALSDRHNLNAMEEISSDLAKNGENNAPLKNTSGVLSVADDLSEIKEISSTLPTHSEKDEKGLVSSPQRSRSNYVPQPFGIVTEPDSDLPQPSLLNEVILEETEEESDYSDNNPRPEIINKPANLPTYPSLSSEEADSERTIIDSQSETGVDEDEILKESNNASKESANCNDNSNLLTIGLKTTEITGASCGSEIDNEIVEIHESKISEQCQNESTEISEVFSIRGDNNNLLICETRNANVTRGGDTEESSCDQYLNSIIKEKGKKFGNLDQSEKNRTDALVRSENESNTNHRQTVGIVQDKTSQVSLQGQHTIGNKLEGLARSPKSIEPCETTIIIDSQIQNQTESKTIETKQQNSTLALKTLSGLIGATQNDTINKPQEMTNEIPPHIFKSFSSPEAPKPVLTVSPRIPILTEHNYERYLDIIQEESESFSHEKYIRDFINQEISKSRRIEKRRSDASNHDSRSKNRPLKEAGISNGHTNNTTNLSRQKTAPLPPKRSSSIASTDEALSPIAKLPPLQALDPRITSQKILDHQSNSSVIKCKVPLIPDLPLEALAVPLRPPLPWDHGQTTSTLRNLKLFGSDAIDPSWPEIDTVDNKQQELSKNSRTKVSIGSPMADGILQHSEASDPEISGEVTSLSENSRSEVIRQMLTETHQETKTTTLMQTTTKVTTLDDSSSSTPSPDTVRHVSDDEVDRRSIFINQGKDSGERGPTSLTQKFETIKEITLNKSGSESLNKNVEDSKKNLKSGTGSELRSVDSNQGSEHRITTLTKSFEEIKIETLKEESSSDSETVNKDLPIRFSANQQSAASNQEPTESNQGTFVATHRPKPTDRALSVEINLSHSSTDSGQLCDSSNNEPSVNDDLNKPALNPISLSDLCIRRILSLPHGKDLLTQIAPPNFTIFKSLNSIHKTVKTFEPESMKKQLPTTWMGVPTSDPHLLLCLSPSQRDNIHTNPDNLLDLHSKFLSRSSGDHNHSKSVINVPKYHIELTQATEPSKNRLLEIVKEHGVHKISRNDQASPDFSTRQRCDDGRREPSRKFNETAGKINSALVLRTPEGRHERRGCIETGNFSTHVPRFAASDRAQDQDRKVIANTVLDDQPCRTPVPAFIDRKENQIQSQRRKVNLTKTLDPSRQVNPCLIDDRPDPPAKNPVPLVIDRAEGRRVNSALINDRPEPPPRSKRSVEVDRSCIDTTSIFDKTPPKRHLEARKFSQTYEVYDMLDAESRRVQEGFESGTDDEIAELNLGQYREDQRALSQEPDRRTLPKMAKEIDVDSELKKYREELNKLSSSYDLLNTIGDGGAEGQTTHVEKTTVNTEIKQHHQETKTFSGTRPRAQGQTTESPMVDLTSKKSQEVLKINTASEIVDSLKKLQKDVKGMFEGRRRYSLPQEYFDRQMEYIETLENQLQEVIIAEKEEARAHKQIQSQDSGMIAPNHQNKSKTDELINYRKVWSEKSSTAENSSSSRCEGAGGKSKGPESKPDGPGHEKLLTSNETGDFRGNLRQESFFSETTKKSQDGGGVGTKRSERPMSISILPSQNEVFRRRMYDEYVHKVLEREERKHHKLIKISSHADLAKGDRVKDHMTTVEKEFIEKARKRLDRFGIHLDEAEGQRPNEDKCEVEGKCVMDGDEIKDARELPKHLQEFIKMAISELEDGYGYGMATAGGGGGSKANGNDLLHEIDNALSDSRGFLLRQGVWSPGSAGEAVGDLKKEPERERNPSTADNSSKDVNIPPVWIPSSQSPVVEKKEFRPVQFESPVLSRKNKLQTQGSSEDFLPWKQDETKSITEESITTRIVNSHSVPSQGLNNLATAPRLPRAQNPTITLLQKAREGQLPKGAAYLEEETHVEKSHAGARVSPGEIIYTVKREYESDPETDKVKKMADLGPRKMAGIGPVTKDGMPVALRSEIKETNQSKWYKQMYDSLHRAGKKDDYETIRYKPRRGTRYGYGSTSGYLSEPEPRVIADRSATLDTHRRQRNKENDGATSTMPRKSAVVKTTAEVYRNQPGRIEHYQPGRSSISEKETKEWWDEVMDIFDGAEDTSDLRQHPMALRTFIPTHQLMRAQNHHHHHPAGSQSLHPKSSLRTTRAVLEHTNPDAIEVMESSTSSKKLEAMLGQLSSLTAERLTSSLNKSPKTRTRRNSDRSHHSDDSIVVSFIDETSRNDAWRHLDERSRSFIANRRSSPLIGGSWANGEHHSLRYQRRTTDPSISSSTSSSSSSTIHSTMIPPIPPLPPTSNIAETTTTTTTTTTVLTSPSRPFDQRHPPATKPYMSHALKESGYESDSTLIFRRRDDVSPLSPLEQRLAYKTVQKGGDVPLHGLRKPAPERPKDDAEIEYIPITQTLTRIRVRRRQPMTSTCLDRRASRSTILAPLSRPTRIIRTASPTPPSPPRRLSSRHSVTLKRYTSGNPRHEQCFEATSNIKFLRERLSSKLLKHQPTRPQETSGRNSIALRSGSSSNLPKLKVPSKRKSEATITRLPNQAKSPPKTHEIKPPIGRAKLTERSLRSKISGGLPKKDLKVRKVKLEEIPKRDSPTDSSSSEVKRGYHQRCRAVHSPSDLSTGTHTRILTRTRSQETTSPKIIRSRVLRSCSPVRKTLTIEPPRQKSATKFIRASPEVTPPSTIICGPGRRKEPLEKPIAIAKSGPKKPEAIVVPDKKSDKRKKEKKEKTKASKPKKSSGKVDSDKKKSKKPSSHPETTTQSEEVTLTMDRIRKHTEATRTDSFFQNLFLRNIFSPTPSQSSTLRGSSVLERARMFQEFGAEEFKSEPSLRSLNIYLTTKRPVSNSRFKTWEKDSFSSRSSSPYGVSWPGRSPYQKIRKFDSLIRMGEFGSSTSLRGRSPELKEGLKERSLSEPPIKVTSIMENLITSVPPSRSSSPSPTRSAACRRLRNLKQDRPDFHPLKIRAKSASEADDLDRRRITFGSNLSLTKSTSSLESLPQSHQGYQRYLFELLHSKRKSPRYKDLHDFYASLERMGELVKTTSAGDLRRRLKNEEIIDYERWKEIRTKEKAEQELKALYSKLKDVQREKDFLFSPKDVESYRWRGDYGLRCKERSVENIRESFSKMAESQLEWNRKREIAARKDMYKPLWRGSSVANVASHMIRKANQNQVDKCSQPALQKTLGGSNKFWSSLSVDQVNALKNQLNEIYGAENGKKPLTEQAGYSRDGGNIISDLKSRKIDSKVGYEVMVPDELAGEAKGLHVRCHSMLMSDIRSSSGGRLTSSLKRSGSISNGRSLDRVKDRPGILTETEKKRLSLTLGKEVMTKVSKQRESSPVTPRETRGAIAVASARSQTSSASPRTCYSLEASSEGEGLKTKEKSDFLLVLTPNGDSPADRLKVETVLEEWSRKPPLLAMTAPQVTSGSEFDSSSENSVKTVVPRENEPEDVPKKIEFFESIRKEKGSGRALRQTKLSSSQSFADLKELFGESESARYATLPFRSRRTLSSGSGRSASPNVTHDRSSGISSGRAQSVSPSRVSTSTSSFESVRRRDVSPDPERYWRTYLNLVKNGSVRRLREKFESLEDLSEFKCVVPKRFQSDPELTRNLLKQVEEKRVVVKPQEVPDVTWLRQKYEPTKSRWRNRSPPIPRIPLRLEDLQMPHINVISKTAELKTLSRSSSLTSVAIKQETDELEAKKPVGKLREKFEKGGYSTSAPDVRDISPYLAGRWVAHKYPNKRDNARSISLPPDLEVGGKGKRERFATLPKLRAVSPLVRKTGSILKQKHDPFANQLFDPSKHRPRYRYQPLPPVPPTPDRRTWWPRMQTYTAKPTVTFEEYTNAPPPPPKTHQSRIERPESPRRYVESEVTIHYRSPVRTEAKEILSEEELARRSAENMRRVYQEERRRKYLQELHDIDSRRHTDNFIPSQKSPIPLNRYDDFMDDSSYRSRSQEHTPEPRLVARALYNFVGQTSRELSFRRGDIIVIRRQIDKNWYEGEHNAMIGLFPLNYVEILPYDSSRGTPKKSYEGQARAKFNFIAQTNLELSLAKGELVVLTRRVDENWFEGRIANKKGIFPVSYVEVICEPGQHRPETPVSSKPVASPAAHSLLSNGTSSGKLSMGPHHYVPSMPVKTSSSEPQYISLPRIGVTERNKLHVAPVNETLHIDTHSDSIPYRALYNYRPQNEDELELKEGDTVYVMEKCDDGWYVGSSQRTGYFGTFPGNYVERL